MQHISRVAPGIILLLVLTAGVTYGSWWVYHLQPARTSAPRVTAPAIPAAAAPNLTTRNTSKAATTTTLVNLRSAPSTSAPVLSALPAGTSLSIADPPEGQWQRVRYANLTGYIFKAYLNY